MDFLWLFLVDWHGQPFKFKLTMNKTSIIQKLSVAVAIGLGAIAAQAQSVTFDFAGGSNQGWTSGGFSAGTALPVSTISGNNYVFVPTGNFQAANVASGYTGTPASFNAAMSAALINPSGYNISYNWYVNTAGMSNATFLQLGTFLNSGLGYYAQDYSTPNEVSLNGAQLASGGTFSGTISFNIAAVFPTADTNALSETFWRLGLIVNGNGTGNGAYFNDISVSPVPEPATLSLCGLAVTAGAAFFRRRKA
jgi:hypothetical protein